MCLLIIGFQVHSDFKLILAQNRDEFYDRPASAATFWNSAPKLLAGKDLETGGTWLGITKNGRIAGITNYREPAHHKKGAPSRGILVTDYLLSDKKPSEYLTRLADTSHYNGFNLVFGDQDNLYYYSNKTNRTQKLTPGLYGLSNHLLDSPWPKVQKGKKALADILLASEKALNPENIFEILADRSRPDDIELPDTGIGLEWERILSPIFVQSDVYGTRSSTAIMIDNQGDVTFIERSFNADSYQSKTATFEFKIVSHVKRATSINE